MRKKDVVQSATSSKRYAHCTYSVTVLLSLYLLEVVHHTPLCPEGVHIHVLPSVCGKKKAQILLNGERSKRRFSQKKEINTKAR